MPIASTPINQQSRFGVNKPAFPASGSFQPNAYTSLYHDLTLTDNLTLLAPLNGIDGQEQIFRLTQDSVGSRLLTLGAGFDVPPSITVTLSTAAGKRDYLQLAYNAATQQWDVIQFTPGF